MGDRRIIYCNCTYAKVIPEETKREVLRELSASGVAFDAVADLCEMSARQDPALKRIADSGNVRIAACFPRAVKWLFHGAQAPLPETGVEILNMREQSAAEIVPLLVNGQPLSPEAVSLTPPSPTPLSPTPLSPAPMSPEPTSQEPVK